jgi:nucleotide-binding universal stress UspA family protein
MRKLLVAVDGSDTANRALDHAIALSKLLPDAQLVVLNVHPEPVVYGEIQVYVSADRMQELQETHVHDIIRRAAKKLEASGTKFTCTVVTGEAGDMIAKTASELKCNAIIMGTRGLSPLGTVLLGSVSAKVIHLADVPVTLVK